jgi:hypothetical protein
VGKAKAVERILAGHLAFSAGAPDGRNSQHPRRRQQGRLGEPGSAGEQERTALIFGPGGTYTSTDLRARASMLETFEAHIQLLSEELEAFLREIIQRRTQGEPQERPPS